MPGDFKVTVYQKNRKGHYIRTTYKFYFEGNLNKILLSAYMENTPIGNKSDKIKHISVNNRSSLPTLDRFDSAKKPSHPRPWFIYDFFAVHSIFSF
jgi:hypothetical protein